MRTTSVVVVFAAILLAGPSWAGGVGRPFDPTWSRLVARLAADGIDRYRAEAVFRDARVGSYTGLAFSLWPREHASLYRGFRRVDSVSRARACRGAYDRAFARAEQRYAVPASVVGAILHIETQCGRNTGRAVILERLAALAMADDPDNVRWNIVRYTRGLTGAHAERVEEQVRARARALRQTFYPEVVALFRLAERERIDPLAVRGSSAGAFGLPQFLPSSYLRFAVDGNGDGQVSLYDADDAIASAAHYLSANGWQPGISHAEQRRVIWRYNHSDAYVDTVLWLAGQIEQTHASGHAFAAVDGSRPTTAPQRVAKSKPKSKPKPKRRASAR